MVLHWFTIADGWSKFFYERSRDHLPLTWSLLPPAKKTAVALSSRSLLSLSLSPLSSLSLSVSIGVGRSFREGSHVTLQKEVLNGLKRVFFSKGEWWKRCVFKISVVSRAWLLISRNVYRQQWMVTDVEKCIPSAVYGYRGTKWDWVLLVIKLKL